MSTPNRSPVDQTGERLRQDELEGDSFQSSASAVTPTPLRSAEVDPLAAAAYAQLEDLRQLGDRVLAPDPLSLRPGLIRMADIQSERIRWLWRGRLALGKITLLDGDPGLGKSTATLDIAARVSTGAALPGERTGRAPAGVVLLSAEDDPGDTIRPRLEAAGADLRRICIRQGAPTGLAGLTPR